MNTALNLLRAMAHPMFEAVQRILNENPFKPFVIVMDDDRQSVIAHREFIIPMKGWDLTVVQRPDDREARLLSPEHTRELSRRGARAA